MTARAYRVVFTRTALDQVDAIAAWWESERPVAPGLFVSELAACVEHLTQPPRIGAPNPHEAVPDLRRALLRRCGYHVYFRVDDFSEIVVIHAVRHSAGGNGPGLA